MVRCISPRGEGLGSIAKLRMDLLECVVQLCISCELFCMQKELQNLEEEENKRFRGFREVIDMISASQKPIVSYGSLNGVYLIYSLLLVGLLVFFLFLLLSSFSSNAFLLHADFTFIHSKFLAPLPPRIDEFSDSLHSVFPQVLDVQHLMRNISGLNKPTSISSALSYLKNHYFAPVDLDIPVEGLSPCSST